MLRPITAKELIALAKSGVDAEVFEEAFMHFIPGSDGLYEELLIAIAMHQPKVFVDLNVSTERIGSITDMLRALRKMHGQ